MSVFKAKMDRLDALLDRKLAAQEAEQARADASLEDARRARMRQASEQRRSADRPASRQATSIAPAPRPSTQGRFSAAPTCNCTIEKLPDFTSK